jgi:hypothetical protein
MAPGLDSALTGKDQGLGTQMNKRKRDDESVIFRLRKWRRSAKKTLGVSALVSSSGSCSGSPVQGCRVLRLIRVIALTFTLPLRAH